MPRLTILTEAELRRVVPLDRDAVDCVEAAFAALATEVVAMPPVLRLDIQDTAIAILARERARSAGAGTDFDS